MKYYSKITLLAAATAAATGAYAQNVPSAIYLDEVCQPLNSSQLPDFNAPCNAVRSPLLITPRQNFEALIFTGPNRSLTSPFRFKQFKHNVSTDRAGWIGTTLERTGTITTLLHQSPPTHSCQATKPNASASARANSGRSRTVVPIAIEPTGQGMQRRQTIPSSTET